MSIDEILSDPLLTVIDRHDEMGHFAIRIGTLRTTVYIDLGRYRTGNTTKFINSHVIHTPTQVGPYYPSRTEDNDWEGALFMAIRCLTSYYKEAVEAGHQPKENWLVKYR